MAQAPIILSSNAIARLGGRAARRFQTRVNVFASGDEQRFSDFTVPRRSYRLNLNRMVGSERGDWIDLFDDQRGAFTSFTFLSPIDNLLVRSEALENASWAKSNCSAAVNSGADPFGIASNRVRRITISSTPATLIQSLSIDASGSGRSRPKGVPLTLSWWFKNTGASPTFDLNIDDNDSAEDEQFEVAVTTTGSWQRFTISGQFTNTNPSSTVRAFLDNFSSTGTVDAFGAQLQLGASMSDYWGPTDSRSGLMTARFSDQLEESETRNDIFDLNLEITEILSGT